MKVLLVCSEEDVPSVNMRSSLLSKQEWEDAGTFGTDSFVRNGDLTIMSIPELHIRSENIDTRAKAAGVEPDVVVFMSKHAATSGEAALTVHPIGNYHENRFGGKERTLVRPSPALMTDALRRIGRYNDMPEFHVCFEVTHHGPWLDLPTFFIEIGSDERNWGNTHAADILANVLLNLEDNDHPTIVGIAGGHYAPRFTEVANGFKVNFGHMLPNYHIEGRDDEDIVRMVKDACRSTGTNMVYVHRKSLKRPVERHMEELISSSGFEAISSSDLDPISGNL